MKINELRIPEEQSLSALALTLKMEKYVECHDYKVNNGRNFKFTKFSFIEFFLTDRGSFSGERPKSASGKSPSCRFHSQPREMLIQKLLNT